MYKNQKGFSVVEAIIIVLIIISIGMVGWMVYKNHSKTSTKSSANTKQTTTTPTPRVQTSQLWAGYLKYGPSNSMTSISGQWTVPNIVSATSSQDYKLSVTWIGIGGGGGPSTGLIQIGTAQDEGPGTEAAGPLYYFAFWECPYAVQQIIPDVQIKPSDVIQASIAKEGSNWSLGLVNKTNAESFQDTVVCDADQTTAEWILEDQPHSESELGTLPKLSSFTFSNLMVNGKTPGLTNQIKLLMVNGGQTIVTPGNLTDDGQTFTVSDVRH